jgi:hypothetical protein
MRVLLISSYELGHQPLHVATPAALLRAHGHDVRCIDLAVDPWAPELATWADQIACSVPMHTATRIARRAIEQARAVNPGVPIAAFGLYAPMLVDVTDTALAGEIDERLVDWIEGRGPVGVEVSLGRSAGRPGAPVPARDLLPPLTRYATLEVDGEHRTAGYLEASHGCVHRCRHCPVPVVYDGRLRVVDIDAVLRDAAQQVDAGARHLTFGDPDFLNGAHHSMRVVRALHEAFPDVTFDCTAKVEHIVAHEDLWPELAAAGCLFVVSAFESVDGETLALLAKGHTAADAAKAVEILRQQGIAVRPSWMPFVPWTRAEHVRSLLDFVVEHDLVPNVDPVQYTIRLLLPNGSLLLDEPAVTACIDGEDAELGTVTWRSTDPEMDGLQRRLAELVEQRTAAGDAIPTIFDAVRIECGLGPTGIDPATATDVPRLSEAWFCCAEPTTSQLDLLT